MVHSPGPWVNDNGVVYSVPLDEIVMVTLDGEAEPRPHHKGLTALVYGHHVGPDHVYTHDGNGRLIAAAPDLLDALKEITQALLWITDQSDAGRLEAVERLHKDGRVIETARALLIKIEGAAQ